VPLRIGIPTWPGYEPAYLARHLGLLDSTQVVLVDFLDGAVADRAFRNGGVDAVMQTLPTAIASAQTDTSLHAVMVLDESAGADALVGGPRVTSLSSLRGKPVGIDASGAGAVLVARALESVGMTMRDVSPVRRAVPDAERELFAGTVAAILTYEPRRSMLVARGAHDLFTSAQMPGEITDVLVLGGATRDRHAQALRHFFRAWHEARRRLLADTTGAATILAAREGTDVATLVTMFRGIHFPDEAESARLLRETTSPMRAAAKRIGLEMQRQGMLRNLPDVDRLIDTTAIRLTP
jgi:NitT/TauT family transport system substrate-binding protein